MKIISTHYFIKHLEDLPDVSILSIYKQKAKVKTMKRKRDSKNAVQSSVTVPLDLEVECDWLGGWESRSAALFVQRIGAT